MRKIYLNVFAFLLAWGVVSAHAIPVLTYDGTLSYDAATGGLSVSSVLTGTQNIMPAPQLLGSSMSFNAVLSSVDTSNSFFTIGNFAGVAGTDDLSVSDGSPNLLLTADFVSLDMRGVNGWDQGTMSGLISATGGSLASMFGQGNLIALNFNLTTVFDPAMFNSGFTGSIDGRIVGTVPEPGPMALLGLGLVLVGAVRVLRTVG